MAKCSSHGDIQIERLVVERVVPRKVPLWNPVAQLSSVIGAGFTCGNQFPRFIFDNPFAIVGNVDGITTVDITNGTSNIYSMRTYLNRFASMFFIVLLVCCFKQLIRDAD